jgi:hypothetical protein
MKNLFYIIFLTSGSGHCNNCFFYSRKKRESRVGNILCHSDEYLFPCSQNIIWKIDWKFILTTIIEILSLVAIITIIGMQKYVF